MDGFHPFVICWVSHTQESCWFYFFNVSRSNFGNFLFPFVFFSSLEKDSVLGNESINNCFERPMPPGLPGEVLAGEVIQGPKPRFAVWHGSQFTVITATANAMPPPHFPTPRITEGGFHLNPYLKRACSARPYKVHSRASVIQWMAKSSGKRPLTCLIPCVCNT